MSLAQNEKILSSDGQDLMTRMANEINRRNKTYQIGIGTGGGSEMWTGHYSIIPVSIFGSIDPSDYQTANILTKVNDSLPTISSGNKITASDINKLVQELENINSDDEWSNAIAVTTGDTIEELTQIISSLEKFENGVDMISGHGVYENYEQGIGSPRGNTSGCNTACKGLCQSCLGTATDSGSSSGSSGCGAGCEGDCYGGCYGSCQYTCSGYCWTGCGSSARF